MKELNTKQKLFIELFEKNGTNISQTAKKVGIARETYHRWYNECNTFKKEIDAIKEGMIDFAESMLYKNIKNGKETSLIFYLKNKAKHRGYDAEQQINQIQIQGIKLSDA